MHACIIRKMGNTLKDSVYAQMKWAINELGLYDEFNCKLSPLEIVLKETGQTIYFRGCDDPLKLKSIKPPFGYIGILWKEEKDQLCGPEEERSINQSVLRGGADSYDFSSYNPPKSKSSWVNKERLVPNPGRVFHHSSYTEAPPEWLGAKFIADAEHLKEVNPAAYEHEYEGVANGDGGSVFDYLELREITDEEISHFDRIFQGEDWGWYPDPWAFNRCHYDAARKTLYIFDELTRLRTSNEETAKLVQQRIESWERLTADSAEMKSCADYRAFGILCREAVKGPGSVNQSMKWLQGLTAIVIDPHRCPDTAKEFSEYEYEVGRDGTVLPGYVDADNHHIDAVRYAVNRIWMRRGA